MTEYRIRTLRRSEERWLRIFLYEAVWQPEGCGPLPREIVDAPALSRYIADWGRPDDDGLLLEADGVVAGCARVRVLEEGYGYVAPATPELSVALLRDYRNRGLGTLLVKRMLRRLRARGCRRVSLSVSKGNFAAVWYRRLGCDVALEREDDYVMTMDL